MMHPNRIQTSPFVRRLQPDTLFCSRVTKARVCLFCFFVSVISVVAIPTFGQDAVTSAPASAQAYYGWLQQCTTVVEDQLPEITRSAEAAATLYCSGGGSPVFMGSGMLQEEAYSRSGGLMNITKPDDAAKDSNFNGTVVCFFAENEAGRSSNMVWLAPFQEHSCPVIGVGNAGLLKRDSVAQGQYAARIENGSANWGYFLRDFDEGLIPTEPIANMVVLWTWTAELVTACTRQGKMPTMYMSASIPGGMDRNNKLAGKRFHDTCPPPIPAGQLGRAYLDALRADLQAVHDHEMDKIKEAARLANLARKEGRGAYTFWHGHSLIHAGETPYDPGFLINLNKDWMTARTEVLKSNDFLLVIGYIALPRGEHWGNFAENVRAAGVKPVWSFTGYDTNETAQVLPGEMFIDQHWRHGDAAVDVEGYDIPILPTSGIVGQSILWMIQAEMAGGSRQ